MLMTPDDFQQLLAARGGHLPSTCPSCGTGEWGSLDEILALRIRRSTTGRYGGGADPGEVLVVAPTCGKCGYMVVYDSKLLKGEAD